MGYEVGVYSFQDCQLAFSGPNINRLAYGVADEGYSVTLEGDKNTLVMAAGGGGMHSLHAAQNGVLTLRLLKTSVTNYYMANAYNFQTGSAANHGNNTAIINDFNRGDLISMFGLAFKKAPDFVYGKDGGMNIWTFDFVRVEFTLGLGPNIQVA